MEYESFFVQQADGIEVEFITHFIDEGNAKTFMADENIPEYRAYILWLEGNK